MINSEMTDKLFLKIFLLIILVGSFLRISGLGQVPVSLYWDEAAMLVDAKVLSATGQDMHGNPWYQLMYPSYGDYKLPVYIWLASLSVKIMGVNEFALRLPSALAGIGTIISAGYIARLLFKDSRKVNPKILQLLTMSVVAFSPWSILFSRTAFEGHLAQFFVSLSIAFLLWIYSSIGQIKKLQIGINLDTLLILFKLITVAVLGAIATYSYFSVRFVWPVIIIVLQLFFSLKLAANNIRVKDLIKNVIVGSAIPLLTFFVLLVPMMKSPLYEASNQFRYSTSSILNSQDYALLSNQLREQAGNTYIDRFFFHRHLLAFKELVINYTDHLSFNYMFVNGDSNLRHGTTSHGLFLIILLPIFIYGLFKLFLNNKRALLVLICWWLIALLPASVPESTPHALRSLNALVPLSIMIGYGLAQFIQLSLIRSNKYKYRLILYIFSVLALLNFGHFYNHYHHHYPAQSSRDWQDGYKELALLIDQNKDQAETLWMDPFEGRFYLWLLAFGSYTPEQIQEIPKVDYKVTKIDNINIAYFDWESLTTNTYKIIVAGETENIKNKLMTIDTEPNWTKEIFSRDGISRFLVVEFGE
jgi:4-amino-4-deoxy-L-arabinose transferase-like glycosyltransferase